jgi:hypothetical protein|tara:strand:- start:281 stop:571 length:291 start_codon:yes stop_codon:yes gene_type:complete
MNMKLLFTKHPEELGETYLEHLATALLYCGTIAAAFIVCLIHAFLPFLFEHTGGDMINKLSTSVSRRTKRKCACATDIEKKKTEKLRPFPAKKRSF